MVMAACGHHVEVLAGVGRQEGFARCEDCEALEERRLEAVRRQERSRARRAGAGIPPAYQAIDFGQLGELGCPGDVLLAAQAWSVQGGGLFLHGPNGTGKTSLAAAAAWAMLARRDVTWVDCASLGRWLLLDFDSPEYRQAQRIVAGTGALVLDDLGQELPADMATAGIREAITNRLNHLAPLFLTSNLRVSEIAARPHYGTWLGSRIAGYCRQWTLEGPDHRLESHP